MTSTQAIPDYLSPPGYPNGTRIRVIQPEGSGSSGILAMGEAPGEHEDRAGLPFRPYAEAGSILERALYRAGVPRSSLTLTNLVWYRPPRNWLEGSPWEYDAIRASKPFNDHLVGERRPKVILALGGLAFRELTNMSGEKCGIEMCRGFVVPGFQYEGIPVVGTYHPSFLRRGSKERQGTQEAMPKTGAAGGGTQGMSLLGALIRDIQLARQVAQEGVPKFCHAYIEGGTLDDWRKWAAILQAHPELPICYDFETQDSLVASDESEMEITRRDVTQVQIAFRPEHALVSAWTPELLPILRQILELPNPKLDWNGRKFDRPILRDMGIRTDLGEWHDVMDLWHHSQPDLPRGLQYAASFFVPEAGPWKHLSATDSLYYGALDVDMPIRIYNALRTGLSVVREPHSGVSLWTGYNTQVVKLAPVLDRMQARGIPVDEAQRQALDTQFGATLDSIQSRLQEMVPESLRPVSPKSGYVRDPKVCQIYLSNLSPTNQEKYGPNGPVWIDDVQLVRRTFTCQVKCGCEWSKPQTRRKLKQGEGERLLEQNLPHCTICMNTGKVQAQVERWARLEPFLPRSWQQVLTYIKFRRQESLDELVAGYLTKHSVDNALKYAQSHTLWVVPTDYQTGRETTAEAGLRRLQVKTGDPVLALVLEHREIGTLRGTFVQGWKPGPDGRVHPNFGFKPATAQLSSDSPNAQNGPKHGDLAKQWKRMIRATAGKTMIVPDWKSFHVITAGFEAQDAQYTRIARIDMHSFLAACGVLRTEPPDKLFDLPDQELAALLAWYRKQPRTWLDYSRPSHPGGMTFAQIRDEIAKRVVLAWEFGQGARSLYMLYQESFAGIGEAQDCQDTLSRLFPKVAQWQKDVRLEADAHSSLLTRFGYVRRFWDVFHRKPVADNYQPRGSEVLRVDGRTGQRWLLRPGDDHEAAVAYRPANDAFGIARSCMVTLGEKGLDEKYGLINNIHDALVFECPSSLVDECVPVVKGIMEAKFPVLSDPVVAPDGLWCETEVSVGPDWDSLEKIKC